MPSQQEALGLVRKALFYLSASSLVLILLSFTFSTAGAPSESLSIYDQSFLPMPQIALNLLLLAFSLLHVKYALYFSSSSFPPSPPPFAGSRVDSQDSGSGMASYLQFLSGCKYARHIRIAICLVHAILLMGVSCYAFLIMLVTGNPIVSSMITIPATAQATASSSICRVVDIEGRSSTGPCLMQMIVGVLEGIASLLLMFEGTSSFSLQGKEGMTPPTLRSQEFYERELELHQAARAGAPPRLVWSQEDPETVADHSENLADTQGSAPRLEYDGHPHCASSLAESPESRAIGSFLLHNGTRRDLELYQGYKVNEHGDVSTEDGLYYTREQIEHEACVKEYHESRQTGYRRPDVDTGQPREDVIAAQVQPLSPTAPQSTRQRSRSRLGGIQPLPPSPHYSAQSQGLQNRYHAREDHQMTPQYLSSPESDATLVRQPTRIPATLVALHRGPADPRSPTYYSPVTNNTRRRSMSMKTADDATSSSRPVEPLRMGSSLLRQLLDSPVPSHMGTSSGLDKRGCERHHP